MPALAAHGAPLKTRAAVWETVSQFGFVPRLLAVRPGVRVGRNFVEMAVLALPPAGGLLQVTVPQATSSGGSAPFPDRGPSFPFVVGKRLWDP